MRERDFGEVVHASGVSPAWPIGYDVSEPYYAEAERLFHVHGARGEDCCRNAGMAGRRHRDAAVTTAMPERLAAFDAGLGFVVGKPVTIAAEEMALLGLEGSGTRVPMRIGDQQVDLDRFDQAGRAYPADIAATDLRFQHCALVTDDAQTAWMRARALGATPISTGGPVTLPAASGGVTAIKFRDPEGHPLEFLQFPACAIMA